MKKIIESVKDLYTTIPAALAALFALLKMLGLVPVWVSDELPAQMSEILLSILSLIMIFRARKT